MAMRAEYAKRQPLKGARITGSLHMTIQTGVLIETLKSLGADVRWASCNIFSTQDHAAAAIAKAGTPVFAVKGESLEEYWDYTDRIFQWPDGGLTNMILDDGGDATMYVLIGARVEAGEKDLIEKPNSEEEIYFFKQIKKRLAASPGWFTKQRAAIKGVTEETTTGVNRLYRLVEKGLLPFPAINVNDSVTKSKFDNKYGCKESLVDGIRRGTDTMMAGKVAVVLRLWRRRQGLGRLAARRGRTREGDGGRSDLRAAGLHGRLEVVTLEDVASTADIFITTTGNKDVIRLEHMREMKDMAIVGNIGHFDNEIQVARLQNYKWDNIKPQVDMIEFPGREADHPAVRRPPAEPRQRHRPPELRDVGLVHQPDAGADRTLDQRQGYENKVYTLPKHLDEKVATLHLAKLGAKLTELSKEQADYIGVTPQGPFKPEHYRVLAQCPLCSGGRLRTGRRHPFLGPRTRLVRSLSRFDSATRLSGEMA